MSIATTIFIDRFFLRFELHKVEACYRVFSKRSVYAIILVGIVTNVQLSFTFYNRICTMSIVSSLFKRNSCCSEFLHVKHAPIILKTM